MPAGPEISVLSFDAEAMVFLFLGAWAFAYFKCMYLAERDDTSCSHCSPDRSLGDCVSLLSDYSQSQAGITQQMKQSISCTEVVFVLLVTAVGTSLFEAAARFAQAPLQVLGSACLCLPYCN